MSNSYEDVAAVRVDEFIEKVGQIRQQLHQVVVGQDETIDLLLTCALTGSHALLVGVPGLAKTLMVKALASTFRLAIRPHSVHARPDAIGHYRL